MKVREALADAARRLAVVSDTARLDAELLMAHALGVERDALLLGDQEQAAPTSFEPLVQRRLACEPVAYITGRRAFWTISLEVGPGVLVPRPDSETLLEAAVQYFAGHPPQRVLDLGTGPGTLLLAALDQWPEARGLGLDNSERAIAYAQRNAERLGLEARAKFSLRWWAEGMRARFDLILCNPPYIEEGAELPPDVRLWEPHEALFAGVDGLETYRYLAPRIGPRLAPGGIACIEIGQRQREAVAALFAAQGFTIESRADLSGIDRALILRL